MAVDQGCLVQTQGSQARFFNSFYSIRQPLLTMDYGQKRTYNFQPNEA